MISLRPSSKLIVSAAVAALPIFASTASAIDIIPTFDSASSQNPSFDPTGSGLQSIMNYVIGQYEDIFETAGHNLTINYRWGDLNGGFVSHTLNTQAGGRETSCTIVFDTRVGLGGAERTWFVDSTPADNSEFAVSQTLWRDLTPAQQASFYNAGANVPSTFEVGIGGNAVAAAPNAAKNGFDLLTYAYSRVGTALGMSASNNSTITETADGDYDFAPANLFGGTLAVKSGSGASIGFLVNDKDMQQESFASGVAGVRRLPSHTDLLAMAKVHNYGQLDIPRREFYNPTGSWADAANWTGNQVPGSNDDVIIRADKEMFSPAFGSIAARNVTIAESTSMTLGLVSNATFNSLNIVDSGSRFEQDGGTVNIGTLTTTNPVVDDISGAGYDSYGGTLSVGRAVLGTDTYLYVRQGNSGATITFSDGLINNGRILANNTTLFKATNGSALDLDGQPASLLAPEKGDIILGAGTTTFDGPISDDFNSVLHVSVGSHVNFTQPWTLGGIPAGSLSIGQDGYLLLSGGADSLPANVAEVNGATLTVEGQIVSNGYTRINAPVVFKPNANVNVYQNTSTLVIGTAEFNGGIYEGEGELFVARATFAADTTINTAIFNMDGPGDGITVLNNGVTATINSGTIDTFGSEGYDGTLSLNGSTLVMNTSGPWAMAGQMNLGFVNGNVVKGQPMILQGHANVAGGGTINVNTISTFENKLIVGSVNGGGTINTASSQALLLKGGFDIANGATLNKTGSGSLVIDSYQNHAPNSLLKIPSGTVTMYTNAGGANGRNLDVQVTGTLASYTDQSLDQLTVNATGLVKMHPFMNDKTVLTVNGYSIAGTPSAPTGRIDLGNNGMIIDHNGISYLSLVAAQVKSAYNNGAWNGNGITSNVAVVGSRSLGFADSTDLFAAFPATFMNQQVDATSTLVRYTVTGDANLDGTVTLADFTRLAASFGTASTWSHGDFNYDGTVTLADFTALAANFGTVLPADLPRGNAVPEPATLSALALGLTGLFRRVRK